METKQGLAGHLLGADNLLEQAKEQIQKLWEDGETRFTPAELETIYPLLVDIVEKELVVRNFVDKFEQISIKQTKLESPPKVGSLEEKIQHEAEKV